ncbi:hypothetical protein RN001_004587 [Aquatica leii]|uniref:Nose resistant-to-fluoxetine protein N-terminal domain-containing protein n=1 Tax=Aquatica leii TaxID=1421715 RepID=A0AAN7QJN9_9COLE|nr:hypothetical protein RN001_004587 [Aquatica leii]
MANLKVCVSLVVVLFTLQCNCATTTKYVSYNSTDLSYLSNGIQIPVPPSNEEDPVIAELITEKFPDLQWLSQLYNHHTWKKRLTVLTNLKCRTHLSMYLDELQNNTLWALKMHDASGRYSSHFLFGNDYWLGSNSLCKEIEEEENGEVAPFPLYFYVATIRLNVNVNLTPVTRQLHLGQCLPRSCTVGDVRRLLKQEASQAALLSVIGVKAVPGEYSMLYDLKFHIMGGVGASVLVLVLIATLFDYIWKNPETAKTEERTNNNNSIGNKELEKSAECDFIKSDKNRPTLLESFKNLLLCFSALTNGKKILNMDYLNRDTITCLHGLRFISISWIILVHSYLEVFAIADNKTLRTVTERSFFYQTISNGTFSVDTFFFISGLLVTITYLRREWKKENQDSNEERNNPNVKLSVAKYFTLLFYRYIRLTPAYLFVLGINELAMRYYHNNSVFNPAIIDHISCSQYWWRNALYINNFYPLTEFCMLWSWYMSNDMQFFALGAILLIIAARGEKCFRWIAGAVVVFMFSSWIATFVIAMQYKYVARIEEPFALFDQLYDKPWLRISPYLVGMATGYTLLRIDYKLVLPKMAVLSGWLISLTCLISLVYGLGREGLQIPASAFYAALGHTAWGLCLAWITIACSTGNGGPIQSLLSYRGIYPLSRLSYCAYLIHPVIMSITSFEMDGPFHLNQTFMMIVHFGNMVISFAAAFIISLGFEAPFVGLLRILTNRKT